MSHCFYDFSIRAIRTKKANCSASGHLKVKKMFPFVVLKNHLFLTILSLLKRVGLKKAV